MPANLNEVLASSYARTHYKLPRRYTNLTSNQMDLWDAFYFLATKAQLDLVAALESAASETERQRLLTRAELVPPGTFDTSTRALTDLTGIDRRAIGEFLDEAEELDLLERVAGLAGGHSYAVRLKDFQLNQKGLLKPLSYVEKGWLKAIRGKNNLALPKRLLNYYLGLPTNTASSLSFDSAQLGNLLRKQDLNTRLGQPGKEGYHPIPPGELAEAHYMLRNLGLLVEESHRPGFYRLDREKLRDYPPDSPLDQLAGWQASPLYREYQQEDQRRFSWLEDLLRVGHYPQDDIQIRLIWRDLTYLYGDPTRYEVLKKKARGQRDNLRPESKWGETWRLYLGELKKRSQTVETLPPFRFPLQFQPAEHLVEWDETLAEFCRVVTEPQLRGRVSAPPVFLSQLKGREVNLYVLSQGGPLYLGPLTFGDKPKGLRQIPELFRQPQANFPLSVRLEGWELAPGCEIELWFQGLKLKTG